MSQTHESNYHKFHTNTLQWRHDKRDGVSHHRRLDCLLNHLFRRRSKKTLNFRATGLCEGNSLVIGEFPAQRASDAENASIWWRHQLHWRHDERNGVSNHRRLECLLNRLSRCRSKKTSNLRVTDLCDGNTPVTGGFPSQRASNAENVPIWWRHHDHENIKISSAEWCPFGYGPTTHASCSFWDTYHYFATALASKDRHCCSHWSIPLTRNIPVYVTERLGS